MSHVNFNFISELANSISMFRLRFVLLTFCCPYSHEQHLGMPHLPAHAHYCLLSCYSGDVLLPNVACYAAVSNEPNCLIKTLIIAEPKLHAIQVLKF